MPMYGVWDLSTHWIHRSLHSRRERNMSQATARQTAAGEGCLNVVNSLQFLIASIFLPRKCGSREKSLLHDINQKSALFYFISLYTTDSRSWIWENTLSFTCSILSVSWAFALPDTNLPTCNWWKLTYLITKRCKTVVLDNIPTVIWQLNWLMFFQISELPLSVLLLLPLF